jgi:RNA polymerase sigma-70 factor (ECF subfamily)
MENQSAGARRFAEEVQRSRQASVWAQQFASGNRDIGEQLAVHIRAVLRRRFLSLGMSPEDTEDLVQECAALVFGTIREYDASKGSLDSWLSGYARNVAKTWFRAAYARRQGEAPIDLVPEIPEASGLDVLSGAALGAALGELNPIDQELLQMRFGFGLSFDEIAEMANISAVNARKRVSRAVEALRRNPQLRYELGFA